MALKGLLAAIWLSARCHAMQQVPMHAATSHGEPFGGPSGAPANWFDPPSPDATGQHIFNTISSLTHRWANTMRKNGHTIAPATIPRGTALHHGTIVSNGSLPTGPDWLGFEFNTAYMYCGHPCRVASYAATRDLKVLVFDGLSAAKTPDTMEAGHMDTQDLLTWGEVRRDRNGGEWDVLRLDALCEWGREFGIDGFVRMQWNFELMYCDFASGLELLEFSEYLPTNQSLVSPYKRPAPPPGWKGEIIFGTHAFINCFLDGQRHDRAGERRVRVDYARAVSFYDPALSSLVAARRGQPTTNHSLLGISHADVSLKLHELRDALTHTHSRSGVDWPSIFAVVYDEYTDRLLTLNHTLALPNATLPHLKNVRQQTLSILLPYLRPADVPSASAPDNISWAAPVAARCARSPVAHVPAALLTRQERLLRDAVDEMLREVCRRVVLVWAGVFDIEGADAARVASTLDSARSHVSELIRWLGWADFNRCNPPCGSGEFCYISMWPLPFPEDSLENVTPRCISQEYAGWPQI